MAIRKICPECGQQYGTRPAVSRKDRKTEICPDCGTKQALDTVRDLLGPEMTAHDAICSASKPQTQVFRSDWTRRDNEADMFVKMVKRLAKGFNFKLCDRIRFEDPETGKKYL